jgi:hypothetical protein
MSISRTVVWDIPAGVQFSIKNSYPPITDIQSQHWKTWRKSDVTHDMYVEVIGDSHVDGLLYIRPERRRDLWDRIRPDAGLSGSLSLNFRLT